MQNLRAQWVYLHPCGREMVCFSAKRNEIIRERKALEELRRRARVRGESKYKIYRTNSGDMQSIGASIWELAVAVRGRGTNLH